LLAQTQRQPNPKMSEGLQAARAGKLPRVQPGTLRVVVTAAPQFESWLAQALPTAVVLRTDGKVVTLAGLPPDAADKLAAQPFVDFVDLGLRVPQEELIIKSSDMTVNAIAAAQAALPQITGSGVVLSVKEQPFDTTDIDLAGRILFNSVFAQASVQHATTMATLAAGAGNSGPFSKGVAPRATITTASFANLMPEAIDTLRRLGVSVQNHSYGVGLENFYGIEAAAYDDQCRRNPYLLHTFSAGNAGTQTPAIGAYAGVGNVANLTGQFKLSKNTISVGEVNAVGVVQNISSRGPAHDGRIKPELVAFGSGGTSEAAALVSGAGVLLQQAFRNANGNRLPPSALVKAALFNSATDVGRANVDYETGFGALNVLGALQTITQNRFVVDSLTGTQTRQYNINVPAGATRLKVTLVWADLPAAAGATTALVNDLDLEVQTPAAQTVLPWGLSAVAVIDSLRKPAIRKRDRLNNAEQVTITAPQAGTYTLRVVGFNVTGGQQPFAVAYEVQTGLQQFTYPVKGLRIDTTTAFRVRWLGSFTTSPGRLEFRTLPGGAWQLITDTLSGATNQYQWRPPSASSTVQLRLTAGSQSILSDTIGIFPAPTMQVGYNCPTQLFLTWNAIPGATGYRINYLAGSQLVTFATTPDTFLTINKTTATPRFFSVTPLLPGVATSAGFTVNYATQGVGCYIKQFAALNPTTDQAPQLQIGLGTTLGLQSIELLKLVGGSFQRIAALPVGPTDFSCTDPSPVPVANTYRLRLSTSTVGTILSDTLTVLYSVAGQSYLFPNPVRAGQLVQLISGPSNIAQIIVYDSQGRRLYSATEQGAVKQIATASFLPGVYIVVVTDGEGRRSVRRLLVQ
jgi:hypothetical protein